MDKIKITLIFFLLAALAAFAASSQNNPSTSVAGIESNTQAAAEEEPVEQNEPMLALDEQSASAAEPPDEPPAEAKPEQPAPSPAPKAPAKPQPKPAPAPAPAPAPTPPPAANCETGSFNEQFLCLMNKHRAANGLGALSYDGALNKVARDHSAWMNQTGTFSHLGINGSEFFERCQAQGTTCRAENIAKGFRSAQHLFELWKNSPGHNKNMLGRYTKTGLGLDGKYATNLFR